MKTDYKKKAYKEPLLKVVPVRPASLLCTSGQAETRGYNANTDFSNDDWE